MLLTYLFSFCPG